MADLGEALARRPIPAHVPPELVRDYPLKVSDKTTENPFDRIIPEVASGPIAFYAAGVLPTGDPGWVFRRSEDLRAIFKDSEHFTARGWSSFSGLIGDSWYQVPVEYDPPEHGPLRALLNPLLAPQRMAMLDQKVRGYARHYIEKFRDRGSCEFMGEFAFKFPIAVFLELMGLPQEDVDQLLTWEMNLLHQPDVSEMANATRSVRDYLVDKLAEAAKNPKEDFIGFIATAKIGDRPLSRDEQVGMAFNFYTGGLDTISTNLGLQFRHLAEHPEDQAWLRANPDRIVLATEELMRAYAAVTTFRICVKEIEIAGVRVMPGDRVAMSTTLAGRDESKYDEPNRVKLDRGPSHDSFAHGPHRCVGMHLARRELHVAIEEFLKAIPEFAIAPGAVIVSTLGPIIQPETLPLVWQAA
ncbi:MAG: cytochrome [Rhizorhabdus sp.]|nr:cytochrome [Rhizorhabdus sp.]